jgi:hypothetical protein
MHRLTPPDAPGPGSSQARVSVRSRGIGLWRREGRFACSWGPYGPAGCRRGLAGTKSARRRGRPPAESSGMSEITGIPTSHTVRAEIASEDRAGCLHRHTYPGDDHRLCGAGEIRLAGSISCGLSACLRRRTHRGGVGRLLAVDRPRPPRQAASDISRFFSRARGAREQRLACGTVPEREQTARQMLARRRSR